MFNRNNSEKEVSYQILPVEGVMLDVVWVNKDFVSPKTKQKLFCWLLSPACHKSPFAMHAPSRHFFAFTLCDAKPLAANQCIHSSSFQKAKNETFPRSFCNLIVTNASAVRRLGVSGSYCPNPLALRSVKYRRYEGCWGHSGNRRPVN